MLSKVIIGTIASLGLAFSVASDQVVAQMNHEMPTTERWLRPPQASQTTQFRRIEQPFWVKGAVTTVGFGLIGLEIWWFLLSKPKSQKAEAHDGIQEVGITVDGGYEPSRILVNAGQRVRLNFLRRDPSSCLEEIRLPDFQIAKDLPLNQVTSIEFTPDKAGTYTFNCGMNMFRGVIEVQSTDSTAKATPVTTTQQSQAELSLPTKSATKAVKTPEGTQEATVTVEKGYKPERVIVEVGQLVRLDFQRHNLSKCFDKLLMPDFDLAIDLLPNQTTSVEFTPKYPGEYEFTCGMKMYRGVVEVKPAT
ncbi:cupredoxin domain-containing protein [Nostoc sp. UHCC 0251]|uniref:cupredoxin domain-containing protein n=1 Tax=Nostoc sp. UHCC 0251 TaxID=3110240 RepID=UPI002B2073F6|nr:cupredoxin domain-containing protein [Nostoc sp. UHCC 0251]MEA5625565.1 cupredoxin domain-containing protein [Nostoc sp. UHCC 0251]